VGARTDQVIGRGKHGLGAITGDRKLKEHGEIPEEEGKIERKTDSAVEKAHNALAGLKNITRK
jgi:uncharacterized protein YjbJ (UPF0337 family)